MVTTNMKNFKELMIQKEEYTCRVDDYGCIHPIFYHTAGENYTSGYLKYFGNLKGKKVKLTIEVID
jgi:hypothetical protein